MVEKTVTKEEIAAVEAEINKAKADELKKLSESQAADIEAKVRKDFEAKKKEEDLARELEEIKKKNEELAKQMEERLKAEREAFEKRLQEIEGQKKGLSTNQSPFQQTQEQKKNIRVIDGIEVDLDKLDYERIQELSRQEWMRQAGISNPDWGKPRN